MNARRRPYALAAFALSCAFAVPHMAYAQDELCDGIDNDQDGTVDETCDCADRFVEPENRNLSIFHLGSHDDGRIAAYGANDFFEISAQGITRTEAPGRLLIDANGLSVTLRAARAYVTENGVEREIGRSTIRDVSRAQVVGTRFETALALVRRVPVAISSATSIPRIRGRIEIVAGDARAFVAWARDGTVHHVDGLSVRTTQIPGARVRAMLHRAADDVFAMSESALLHFDGTAWTTVLTTTPALPFVGLTATGAKIYLLARRDSVGGGVLHLVEGATHTTFDLEPTTAIWSLCAAPFGLYATDRGALVRWDGHAFVRLIDTMPFEYEAIDGSSPTDVVAVGDGAVVHYDGRTFRTIHHEPGRSELSDVRPTALDTLDTPERVVHRGDGFPARD